MEEKENIIIDNLINKYSLSTKDKKEFKKIILPIVRNDNFKVRLTDMFPHHGNITLGEHIIEDAIVTYKISKKKKQNKDFRHDLAVIIAMFHDLYTIPWQNNKDSTVKHFFHKHGFRHPVEAVINAITWYPDYFKNKDEAKIIIDGIVHHMHPLPVSYIDFDKISYFELKNEDLCSNLLNWQKDIIVESLRRRKIGPVSISKSIYNEGAIMSKADRIVSRKQINDFTTLKSLITGHNKNIK